eukprot:13442512-Alexandrium_andersonii.AAC.1
MCRAAGPGTIRPPASLAPGPTGGPRVPGAPMLRPTEGPAPLTLVRRPASSLSGSLATVSSRRWPARGRAS